MMQGPVNLGEVAGVSPKFGEVNASVERGLRFLYCCLKNK